MSYDPDNVFAKILRGELPCTRVYEDAETLAIASQAGFRCFVTAAEFQKYVQAEVLADEIAA